jgi:hypothetical protein
MDSKQHVNTAEPAGVRARSPDHSADDRLEQQLVGAVTAARGQGQLRSGDVLALQRAVGNQAVQRLLAAGSPGAAVQRVNGQPPAVVQRVVAKLIAGLNVDSPNTFDTGGGHSYADHGAHTTEAQQRTRLRTGVAPSGRASAVPSGAGASKFASDAKHSEGMKAAAKELTDKNKGKKKLKGITGPMPLDAAGPIYYRDGTSATGSTVQVDLTKVDGSADTFRLNTMFPMP